MNADFLKILGIIVLIIFLVYLASKSLKLHLKLVEGLTNPDTTTIVTGEAGSAANYASTLKNQVTQIQDTLLISKYRKDYETIILNMDDYINAMMLKTVLNLNISDNVEVNSTTFKALNDLNGLKSALNNVMKYVDSS
jgi:hypothetical protein